MQVIINEKFSSYLVRETNNLQHHRSNKVTFGSNSLRSMGPQIWNGLPNVMKSAENLSIFKNILKSRRALISNVYYINMYITVSLFYITSLMVKMCLLQIEFRNIHA